LTARARATFASQVPTTAGQNPILLGPAGPIKHVIYITRENKTYDADLGDLHPGRPDNALTLFGRDVTPNLHNLETQFIESDNFNYQGFASVVGHMWEDAGMVSDVFERGVAADTGTHFSHGDTSWGDPTNYPASGLLTEQAYKAGLSVRTYNEETAQQAQLLPAAVQAPTSLYPNYDLHTPDVQREAGWEQEFRQFVAHQCTGDLAATYGAGCQLPALEYVYLGEDHTTVVDEPGYPTIQAQVADNDLATAKVIDAVSHSPYWNSTAIFVVEDDPQGTGDSQSAYRGFLAIASPWAKHGYISHASYNLTSVVGAIDRVLGLPPITDFALTSRPLDDLFTSEPNLAGFTADGSGVARYPFVPLGGTPPVADTKHGIYSFATPDQTNPAVSNLATWRQIKGNRPLPTLP
ncbi:MAG TPA: alkaline phosphatase family protein, partial [Solirubrobacteraceae bacterium]|nr:alkaline phosphatase family protein [Solirubrobacteraceae bacterium]